MSYSLPLGFRCQWLEQVPDKAISDGVVRSNMCTYFLDSSSIPFILSHRCIGTNFDGGRYEYNFLDILKAGSDGLVEVWSWDPARGWVDSARTSWFSRSSTIIVSAGSLRVFVWFKSTRSFKQAKMIIDAGLTHLFISTESKNSLEHALSFGQEGHFPRGRCLRRNLEQRQITVKISCSSAYLAVLWRFGWILEAFLLHLWFIREAFRNSLGLQWVGVDKGGKRTAAT